MPMRPTQDKQQTFKIVCETHGLLSKEANDHLVATLVRDEHQEQCPADCEIFGPGSDEFESAAALERADRDGRDHDGADVDTRHCPKCCAFVGGNDECGRCGRRLEGSA